MQKLTKIIKNQKLKLKRTAQVLKNAKNRKII